MQFPDSTIAPHHCDVMHYDEDALMSAKTVGLPVCLFFLDPPFTHELLQTVAVKSNNVKYLSSHM